MPHRTALSQRLHGISVLRCPTFDISKAKKGKDTYVFLGQRQCDVEDTSPSYMQLYGQVVRRLREVAVGYLTLRSGRRAKPLGQQGTRVVFFDHRSRQEQAGFGAHQGSRRQKQAIPRCPRQGFINDVNSTCKLWPPGDETPRRIGDGGRVRGIKRGGGKPGGSVRIHRTFLHLEVYHK